MSEYRWTEVPPEEVVEEQPAAPDAPPCTFCDRPSLHLWVDGVTRFCTKHWSRSLAETQAALLKNPHFVYVPIELRPEEVAIQRRVRANRVKDGPKSAQGPGYGAKGNKNWEKRAGQ